MTPLWLAYLALAVGLMVFGGVLVWLGLRPRPRPAGMSVRVTLAVAAVVFLAGAVAAVILEKRATGPW